MTLRHHIQIHVALVSMFLVSYISDTTNVINDRRVDTNKTRFFEIIKNSIDILKN